MMVTLITMVTNGYYGYADDYYGYYGEKRY